MHTRKASLPIFLFFFFLLLYPLLTSSGITVKNSTTIPGCPSFDCGNGLKIRYPFWIAQEDYSSSNTSTPSSSPYSYCGRPLLNLTCMNNSIPSLHLPSGEYVVTDIDYSAQTLTVTDADLLSNSNSNCPIPHHNLTFEPGSSLNYTSSDSYLTFFFNCSVGPPEHNKILCLASGHNRSSYVFREDHAILTTKGYDWHKDCEYNVVAPVLNLGVGETVGGDDPVILFLLRGFQLGWGQSSLAGCWKCENSSGLCGFNFTGSDYGFKCFCNDGSDRPYCRELRGKSNLKKGIIAGNRRTSVDLANP